ncbi:MAG: sulfite exporter TauE/SafE family protein [Bdellovibrio sp.]|nr:sulfite exporter TauE/SafE family protein [Bdellovibrio sp.]
MSASLLLAGGILASSFFGSWHCAAMCCPIASLMAERRSLWAYHLGRLASYVALGALGGSLGQFFLNSQFVELRIVSAFLFSLVLLFMGLKMLFPGWAARYLPAIQHQGIVKIFRHLRKFHLNQSGFVVGLLTALLPCGWLYTYVTAAIATQNPLSGAIVMSLFWLGGLPALSVIPSMIRGTLQSVPLRQQKIAGGVLIGASLYSILSFMLFH